MRGDYVATRTLLKDALRLFRELGDAQGTADTLVSLGVVAHFLDDLAAARSLYEEGLATYRVLGNQQGMAMSLNNLGELALEQGDLTTARRLEEESLVLASEIGDRERIAYALATLGGVAALQGEFERALRLGAAATSIREAIGETVSAAWRARFERWLEPARQALTEEAVAAAWAEGRVFPLEQAIEHALRPAGSAQATSTTSDRPLAGRQLSGLTHREREVAALIARGLTNRQIAAELVITEGTAANHVKHILARLTLDSRVQVATWAIEHGLHRSAPS
jgi:DNA-binding NarL/FixJ family response regulator